MKKQTSILTFLLCLLTRLAFGQWSQNPGQPLPVTSQTSGTHTSPIVHPDGTGGLFVFWGDSRGGDINSNPWLYGQHFNAAGQRLFPDTGKLVIGGTGTTKTGAYGIAFDHQGNFWISWGTGTNSFSDSILLNKFNRNTFQPIWPKAKTLARRNNLTLNIIGFTQTNLIPNGDSLLMTYQGVWMGGFDFLKAMHVSKTGVSLTPDYGISLNGMGYGPCDFVHVSDGLIVVRRGGNGLGAGAYATKLNFKGNIVWGPVTLTTGTPGLGYAFKALPDGQGGFVLVYVQSGSVIMATRWDGNGNPVWNPVHRPVCDYSSSQDTPDFVLSDGSIYVVWRDNRPPASNADVYMQKLNLSGERLWNPNGRIVFRLDSYIPTPKIMEDSYHNLIVTSYHSSVGFVGQKVRPDSTFAWAGPGRVIATQTSGNCPFYEQFSLTSGPGGVAYPVWNGSQARRNYIASIDSLGQFTALTQTLEPILGKVFPNPADEELNLNLPVGGGKISWEIMDVQGLTLRQQSDAWVSEDRVLLPLSGLPAGLYFLRWKDKERWNQVRFIKK